LPFLHAGKDRRYRRQNSVVRIHFGSAQREVVGRRVRPHVLVRATFIINSWAVFGPPFSLEVQMALPIYHDELREAMISGSALSVATGIAGVIRAPFKGAIKEVGTMIGSAVATADATVTTSIAGT